MEKYSKTIEDKFWLDKDTCVVVFGETFIPEDGNVHVEGEVHEDEEDKTPHIIVLAFDEDGNFIDSYSAEDAEMSEEEIEYFKSETTKYYNETK